VYHGIGPYSSLNNLYFKTSLDNFIKTVYYIHGRNYSIIIQIGMISGYACQRIGCQHSSYGYILPDNHGILYYVAVLSSDKKRTVPAADFVYNNTDRNHNVAVVCTAGAGIAYVSGDTHKHKDQFDLY
jgi:hypothetical protein